MSYLSLIRRITYVSVLLGLAGQLAAALPERKTFQFGEFIIEASAGDEAYVEALAVQLGDFHLPKMPPPVPPKLSLEVLAKRREYFLGQIAAQLGLDRPTEKMGQSYDSFLHAWQSFRGFETLSVPRRYALWRKPELLARMETGETVSGFRRDEKGELTVDFNFSFNLGPDEDAQPAVMQQQMVQAWRAFIWPVNIGTKTPVEDAAASLAQLREVAGLISEMNSQAMQRTGVFTVLHEAVEMGVVASFLTSQDRRWFCDGVANYVAFKVTAAEIGVIEANGYYDLEAQLAKFAPLASRIDLANWPAAENLEKLKYPAELNAANYAFATKVIADVCAKHGDSLLPKLFKEIGRTPREKVTMDTVYKVFKRLTKEDLRSYLPKPAAKS